MIVYITGVSGSGKTTLCKELESYGVVSLGGSEKIMAFHGLTDLHEYSYAKIETNLSRAIPYWQHCHEVDASDPSTLRAMDYHFYLSKPNGATAMPVYPFTRQTLLGVVLLEPPEAVIKERRERNLQKRPDRCVAMEGLREEVRLERHYCTAAVAQLGCPHLVLPNVSFEETLKSVLNFTGA